MGFFFKNSTIPSRKNNHSACHRLVYLISNQTSIAQDSYSSSKMANLSLGWQCRHYFVFHFLVLVLQKIIYSDDDIYINEQAMDDLFFKKYVCIHPPKAIPSQEVFIFSVTMVPNSTVVA